MTKLNRTIRSLLLFVAGVATIALLARVEKVIVRQEKILDQQEDLLDILSHNRIVIDSTSSVLHYNREQIDRIDSLVSKQ